MKRRRAAAKAWLLGILGLAVVGVGLRLTVWRDQGVSIEVENVAVSDGSVVMTIETNGTVEPLSTVQVGCEVTGKIIELTVDNDEPVEKDQIICRIDPELVQAELNQAQAEFNRATAAFDEAKVALNEQTANLPVMTKQALARKQEAEAAYKDAAFNWNRVKELKEKGDATDVEANSIEAAWLRAQASLNAAEAAHDMAVSNETYVKQRAEQAVAQAEAAVKLATARRDAAQTRLERCIIRSPITGIVLKRSFDVGTTVNAMFQTPILFLLAPPLDRMRVSAKVSESDINHVDIGQMARFNIEGRGKSTFEGKIVEKRNQPDIIQNVVTYTVVFEVPNDARHTLLPGLTVNVIIECVNRSSVARIPNSALRFKPPIPIEQRQALVEAAQWPERPRDKDGQAYDYCEKSHAWKYDAARNEWQVVPLWVGVTDNTETEILWGAKAGDQFVRKARVKTSGTFDFKEMLKQADPTNRRII